MAYAKKTTAKKQKKVQSPAKRTVKSAQIKNSSAKRTVALSSSAKSKRVGVKKRLGSDFWIISLVVFFATTAFMAVATGTTYLSVMSDMNQLGSQEAAKNIALNLKGVMFDFEVVNSREDMYLGLSGRESLCSACGMLFVFPDSAARSFVMRNMNFPLDIIFISQGRIVKIHHNLPPEGAFPVNFYASDAPADVVLEINAGLANMLGLRVGDRLNLPDLSVYK